MLTAIVVLLVLAGRLELLATLCVIVACAAVAWRYPVFTIVAYLILVSAPHLVGVARLGGYGGVGPSDLPLVGMVVALVSRLATRVGSARLRGCVAATTVFGLWILFEIVRNAGPYGVSALGEFRQLYLVVVLPFYIGAFLDDASQVRSLVRWAVGLSVAPVLAVVLLQLRGPVSERTTSAMQIMGLLLGIALVWITRERPRVSRLFDNAVVLVGAAVIVVQQHRSVWLAGFGVLLAMLMLNVIPVRGVLRWMLPIVLIGVIAFTAVTMTAPQVVTRVLSRGEAVVEVADSAAWRLYVWRATLFGSSAVTLAGEGFGSYWSVYVPELGTTEVDFPHNIYVMTLVKLGWAGLVCYVWLMLCVGRRLKRARVDGPTLESRFVLIGRLALVAQTLYGVAYGFDPWAMTFLGVGLAAAANVDRITAETPSRFGTVRSVAAF
jgi:O-antigen ligase